MASPSIPRASIDRTTNSSPRFRVSSKSSSGVWAIALTPIAVTAIAAAASRGGWSVGRTAVPSIQPPRTDCRFCSQRSPRRRLARAVPQVCSSRSVCPRSVAMRCSAATGRTTVVSIGGGASVVMRSRFTRSSKGTVGSASTASRVDRESSTGGSGCPVEIVATIATTSIEGPIGIDARWGRVGVEEASSRCMRVRPDADRGPRLYAGGAPVGRSVTGGV